MGSPTLRIAVRNTSEPLPYDRIQGALSAFHGTLANVSKQAPGVGGRARDVLSMLVDFKDIVRSVSQTLGSESNPGANICVDLETGQCTLDPQAELELGHKLVEIQILQERLASMHLPEGSKGCVVCSEAALIARQLRNIVNAWLEKRAYRVEEYQIKTFRDWEKHMFDPVLYDVQLRYYKILHTLFTLLGMEEENVGS